jgi:hypothetical protein
MQIRELFVKSIDRAINGVVKADQKDPESIWQELDEYVVTKELDRHLRRFFDAYLASVDRPHDPALAARSGVWVSGFFGSGKSHFIKILSYLLANLDAESPASGEHRRAADFFGAKVDDPMLLADIKRAVTGDTDVVLFNIDAKASKGDQDAILQVFLRVFNEMQGFCGDTPHIAEMERYLISKGVYERFRQSFAERAGDSWESQRDAVDFMRDEVIHGLSSALGMSEDSAAAWFDNARDSYRITIEKFAKLVRDYLDARGSGHRIVFLVDEVGQFIGSNTQLMLNLQTITEELGTHCQGRTWVVVTSQEDIDAAIGEANKARSQDFSKIQGRFHTRLSLSSSNTDEVIAKRLLEKTEPAEDELKRIFAKQGDILNNQLSFVGNTVTLRGFRDADDFAAHFPFAPYQFQLLQKIFESIRKVGATGLHLSRGERSLLDAFQSAAIRNAGRGLNALVPLADFYPSIESFLDTAVKRAIDQADENAALDAFDRRLLRVLFLVRYIADILKPNIDNLATLCVDEIDADKLALKRRIEDSLNRLEKQNLVSRNGDLWFFLTNEERDVSQEIKAVDVASAELTRLLSELVFDEIFNGQTKVRHRETKADYEFNRVLDGAPWRQASHELTLEVLTPLGEDYEMLGEARCIGRSAAESGRAIIRLAEGERLDTELRTYLRIEKYIAGPKMDAATPSLRKILEDRKAENRERRARLVAQLGELITMGDIYALGQKLQSKAAHPLSLLDETVNYLISNTYTKLAYLKVRQSDPPAEIRAVLTADDIGQSSLALDGEEGNAKALTELRDYLKLAATQNRVLLSDIVDRFVKAPWGWKPEWEIVLLIARLFMAGEIKLMLEGADLEPKAAVDPLTKSARFKQVSILMRKKTDAANLRKARELHREMFSRAPRDDEDGLIRDFRDNLAQWQTDLNGCKGLAAQKHYPGLQAVEAALADIGKQLAIRDSYEFLEALNSRKEDWLDTSDAVHEVTSFYKTQIASWRRMLEALSGYAHNQAVLDEDVPAKAALAQLHAIRDNPAPYHQVNQIDGWIQKVDAVNTRLVSEKREQALNAIEAHLAEVGAVLDEANADAALRNKALHSLQQLKLNIAGQGSIPQIAYLQGRGTELVDEAITIIAEACKPPAAKPKTGTEGGGVNPSRRTVPVIKPAKTIRAAELAQGYLETEFDIDDYLAKLRAALTAAVKAGQKVRIG